MQQIPVIEYTASWRGLRRNFLMRRAARRREATASRILHQYMAGLLGIPKKVNDPLLIRGRMPSRTKAVRKIPQSLSPELISYRRCSSISAVASAIISRNM